ncbi:diaminopimelate decarboxylase [Paraglaciecola polaris]|uniref:Diaminopimelate decarboxylase n=1 Tax=Paraglaciecola polaris LMG 21857 TaxID=1129793 RepID=K6YQ57_9ALTE|nr:diaminopimelate decarboxylase [Paraglaciecola polaris]GAC34854.1 diaminopimelate decarboxylase [Paraglaciecola polaris LMG 21857]|tara:strand:- start:63 stop:1310 length:1248 start_codon:yes stop_codon:yes gene_type:complete
MDFFGYKNEKLYAEEVSLQDIAQTHGTPCYVYSRATIERHWLAFDKAAGAHPHLICYAVKANSNLGVLSVLAKLGSGFDIVSGGELLRVLAAGGDPTKIVFSGVGKTPEEIALGLKHNIKCFNVESPAELARISQVAVAENKIAPISIRVNPDVDAKTHPYISTGLKANKFGIEREQAVEVYRHAASLPNLAIKGIDCHIGSQLTEIAPFVDALDKLLVLIDELAANDIILSHLDVGGGLGVTYKDETPPHPDEYTQAITQRMEGRKDLQLIFEPGRAIMANAGVLLSKVEFLKQGAEKNFAIIDAAMNDLIRPALYSAWQSIIPLDTSLTRDSAVYDVVGPICETGDFIGKERELAIEAGDYLAVRSAGAYGFVMASNYNSRCRAAEIMVDKDKVIVVREREKLEDLWRGESVL